MIDQCNKILEEQKAFKSNKRMMEMFQYKLQNTGERSQREVAQMHECIKEEL